MFIRKVLTISATLGLLSFALLFTLPANADLVPTDPPCDVAASVFDPAYDGCAGAFEGNVTDGGTDLALGYLNDENILGGSWTFGEKLEGDGAQEGGCISTTIGGTTGTVSICDLGLVDLALAFKAGNSFSIYWWNDAASPLDIDWSTVGSGTNFRGGDCDPSANADCTINGLSNLSYYTRAGTPPPPPSVPEPGTLALLALGLLSVGVARRRRTSI